MPTAVVSKTPLKKGERVVNSVTLPRVPFGTKGTVTMVSGLTWTRYWVRFDNGESIGTLHRDKLINDADLLARKAAASAGTGAPTSQVAVASTVGGEPAAAESVGGVPGYLIERSKAARARWAAKQAG